MYSPRDHGLQVVRIRSLRENFKLKYIIVAWENVTSSSASVHFCTLALSTGPSHHWHPEIFMPSTTKFFLAELPALLMEDTTGSETYNPSVSSTTSPTSYFMWSSDALGKMQLGGYCSKLRHHHTFTRLDALKIHKSPA